MHRSLATVFLIRPIFNGVVVNHANLIISQAESNGARAAVRLGRFALTYKQFVNESSALAAGLRRAGVSELDRVMMYADNSVEHLITYHACARLGAVFAPVHPEFRSQELVYALKNARPEIVITNSRLLGDLESAMHEAGHVAEVVILNGSDDAPSFDITGAYRNYVDLHSLKDTLPPLDVEACHPLLICYTSGTSSLPKPVLRSHGAETWSAKSYGQAWGFDRDDSILVAMSLSWVYGLSSLSQTALATGATVVIDKKFSPTRTLELMDAHAITAFAGTTSMYSMMLNILQERSFDTSSMRKLFLGGEPRNEVVISAIEQRFGLRLCEGWAMTETFPALAIHPVHDLSAPQACLGRAVPGVEIRLVDEDGAEVEADLPGEALIRSPGDFLGYYNEPGLTNERRTRDGWIRSGDFMSRSADGYFRFVSRKSELIIRGGVNISPAEIESAVSEYPDVLDSIVVGLPDPVLGEMVVALVTWRGQELDNDVIKAFLEARIAKFKVPAYVLVIEEIPRGTTGKKNRTEAKTLALSLLAEMPEPVK